MSRVAQRVKDKRLLRLLRAYLNAGVMENGLVQPSEEGVPQGELKKLGLSIEIAAGTAGSAHGPWRLSNSPPLSMALSNAYFKRIGLFSLYEPVSR